jgi:hypothetical protein
MTTIAAKSEVTARTLLTDLGIGQFNATMVIQYMFVAPATTDPKSPPIILLVEKIQRALAQMGADVVITGALDLQTASYLSAVVGERWMTMPWSATVSAVVSARDNGLDLSPTVATVAVAPAALSGPLDFLPDVPGGLVTYGIAAFFLYRYLKKK